MRCRSCSPRGTRHTPRGPRWQRPVTRPSPLLALPSPQLHSRHCSPRGRGCGAALPTRGLLRPACSVVWGEPSPGHGRRLQTGSSLRVRLRADALRGREPAMGCPPGPRDPPAAGSCKLSPAGNHLRLPIEVCRSSSSEVCAVKYLVRSGCPSPFARGCGRCSVMPSFRSHPLCGGQAAVRSGGGAGGWAGGQILLPDCSGAALAQLYRPVRGHRGWPGIFDGKSGVKIRFLAEQ